LQCYLMINKLHGTSGDHVSTLVPPHFSILPGQFDPIARLAFLERLFFFGLVSISSQTSVFTLHNKPYRRLSRRYRILRPEISGFWIVRT
jgi:hypothetical protein